MARVPRDDDGFLAPGPASLESGALTASQAYEWKPTTEES